MINIILKNKKLILLYKYSIKIFKFINKHFYILPIINLLSKIRTNKFYKIISWITKVLIILNIIIGTGFILYFTDFVMPINNLLSIYNTFLKPYIDFIKNFWNNLFNIPNIEESFIKDSANKIKNEVKSGIKEAIKESIDEISTQMHEDEVKYNSNLYKNVAIFTSLTFLFYYFIMLPGASATPEVIDGYNTINQILINSKITIKDYSLIVWDYFNNNTGKGPGNPPIDPINTDIELNPITNSHSPSPNTAINDYFKPISPTSSVSSSDTVSTVTPNTPTASSSTNLSPTLVDSVVQTNSNIMVNSSVQTLSEYINTSTQTDLNGVNISTQTTLTGKEVNQLVKVVSVLDEVLPEDSKSTLLKSIQLLDSQNIAD